MMNELSVEVAELHKAANFLLRRRQWPIFDNFDFLGRDLNISIRHSVAQVLHLVKTEAFFKPQLQALLLRTL
jgi:hypothetical protein